MKDDSLIINQNYNLQNNITLEKNKQLKYSGNVQHEALSLLQCIAFTMGAFVIDPTPGPKS